MEKITQLKRYIVPRVRNRNKLTDDEKLELKTYIDEYNRLQDINRGETDLLFFAYNYFGENRNKDNTGNWIPEFKVPDDFNLDNITEYAPHFHEEICDIMNVVSNEEINKRVVVAAPRSHAKSSYLSKAFPIHEICYRKRFYIILISETPSVSSANLEWIKLQLQSNEKLRRDFGPLLHTKQQMNPKDNTSEFIAWVPKGKDEKKLITFVQAVSTGQALRGRNWNGKRPDLIVCDDLEGKSNTNTAQLRQELKDWFAQIVIPLGDPEGKRTAIVFMGTTVHPQSLLIDVMERRSDFESRKYKALITPPKRQDLWAECESIYKDRENKTRARDAELFFTAHRDEMIEGSEVLWEEVQPLFKLMKFKWDDGSKAFNSEYQNNPIDEESMIFNPEKFVYWNDKQINRNFLNGEYFLSMGVDLAMGKQRGDYSAISTVAKYIETDTIYDIDSYGERLHPDEFMKVIVEKVLHFRPDVIAVEAQAAQEFFADMLQKRLISCGYPANTRLIKVKQRSRKELRLEALLPRIESGEIQFDKRHSLLLEQFQYYGTNMHDDLPDSFEMAVSAAGNSSTVVRTIAKRMR
nr:phage terminase large subunit [Bacillus cereus]